MTVGTLPFPLDREFQGRTTLVSGAAGGIGRATALLFAARGAHVACIDIAADDCRETVRLIQDAGGEAAMIEADLSTSTGAKQAVAAAISAFGHIDHAFNNAGVTGSHADPFDEARVRRTLAVNLEGVYWAMEAEIAHMLARGGGTIVNTSSIAGLSGAVGALDYTAAKHGVVGLTGAAARRYGPAGIRINAVCPGLIRTRMSDEVERDEARRQEIVARLSPITGAMGEAIDIAEAVLFLSSDRARFILGVALPVDGGFSI